MPDFRSPRSITAGLMDIEIRDDCRNQGLGTYLLGEMIREAKKELVMTFEAHAAEENTPLVALLRQSMRWNIADRGEVLCKKIS